MNNKPKIGIRPIIDGRYGGVREALGEQTNRMASSVQKVLESSLKYRDGQPVECVISPVIGGVAEASKAEILFAREHVEISISVTPCWAFGSETIDIDPQRIKAVWGFNGSERSGAVYLAAALAAYTQKGLPVFGIYGKDVQDKDDESMPDDVRVKLLQFSKAALAVVQLRGMSYLSIGNVSMGIMGSYVSEPFFQHYLGMRNEYVDMSEIAKRIELGIYDNEEYSKALQWVKDYCKEGEDPNRLENVLSKERKQAVWEESVKIAMIIRDLMVGNPRLEKIGFPEEAMGHNAIACGFQGQRNWTDYRVDGDFAESVLCSSFDWNGLREPYVVATENDSLNAVSMVFAHLLSDSPAGFADVRTYWSPESIERVSGWKPEGLVGNGCIHLKNSGAVALDFAGTEDASGEKVVKSFWDLSAADMDSCLHQTTWHAANRDYFRGGGFSSKVVTPGGMPFTLIRLNLVEGQGPVLQFVEGHSVMLPPEVHRLLDERTDKTWPTMWFVPRLTGKGNFSSVYSVMNSWGANHCAFSYGHIGAQLIVLASMLRIPVSMQNLSDEVIFRPSAWNAFGGLDDAIGSDYRACSCFGSLY